MILFYCASSKYVSPVETFVYVFIFPGVYLALLDIMLNGNMKSQTYGMIWLFNYILSMRVCSDSMDKLPKYL